MTNRLPFLFPLEGRAVPGKVLQKSDFMQNYRFGVLLLRALLSARGTAGIRELGVWVGPSGSAAAARQAFVGDRATLPPARRAGAELFPRASS